MSLYLFSIICHTAKLLAYSSKPFTGPKTYDFFQKVSVASIRRDVRMVMTVAALLKKLHVLLGSTVDLEHDLFARYVQAVDVNLHPRAQSSVNDFQ